MRERARSAHMHEHSPAYAHICTHTRRRTHTYITTHAHMRIHSYKAHSIMQFTVFDTFTNMNSKIYACIYTLLTNAYFNHNQRAYCLLGLFASSKHKTHILIHSFRRICTQTHIRTLIYTRTNKHALKFLSEKHGG